MIGGGIVIVALAAAAGGVIWMPREDDVDRGAATVRGLAGAGLGALVAVGLVLAVRRSGWWRRLGVGGALVAAIIALTVALGAMLGSATAPSADPVADAPDIEPRPDPAEPAEPVDPVEPVEPGGAGGGLGGDNRMLSEHAVASLVDSDGDGHADLDDDGNPIVAFDADGDGVFEGRLVPCSGSDGDDARPDEDDIGGGIHLDFTCDGRTDRLIRLSPSMLRSVPGNWVGEGDLRNDLDGNGIADGQEPDDIGAEPDRDEDDDDKSDIGTTVLYVLLTLLAAGAVAALAWGVVRFARRERSPAPSETTSADAETETVDDQAAEAAIGESIETLLGHPDPRLGIRAAYAVLLDALSEAGFARRSFEAPEEHLERCLRGLQIEPGPLRELLRLFALARYSTHEITERERAEALDALRRSQDLLRRRQGAAPAMAIGGAPSPPRPPLPPAMP